MSERKITVLFVTAFAFIIVAAVMWANRPLLRAKNVVAATFVADAYNESRAEPKNLTRQEIEEVVSVINSPKKDLQSYSTSSGDCCFELSMDLKDGTTQRYHIFLMATGKVYISERKVHHESVDNPFSRNWVLDEGKEAESIFKSKLFQSYYSSSYPLFPLIYLQGEEITGNREVDGWEFKNVFDEWVCSESSPSTQNEKKYMIKGGAIGVVFPNNPTQRTYELYDEHSRLIEKGELTSPQFYLPKKKGEYTLKLMGEWDYEGKRELYGERNIFTQNDEVPNTFRGRTTTTIRFLMDEANSDEEYLELVPLKDTLNRMRADYVSDAGRFEIKSFSKHNVPLDYLRIRTSDIKKTEFIDWTIGTQTMRRTVVYIDNTEYVSVEILAYDLGMLFKKNKIGAYFTENKQLAMAQR